MKGQKGFRQFLFFCQRKKPADGYGSAGYQERDENHVSVLREIFLRCFPRPRLRKIPFPQGGLSALVEPFHIKLKLRFQIFAYGLELGKILLALKLIGFVSVIIVVFIRVSIRFHLHIRHLRYIGRGIDGQVMEQIVHILPGDLLHMPQVVGGDDAVYPGEGKHKIAAGHDRHGIPEQRKRLPKDADHHAAHDQGQDSQKPEH